MNTNVRIHVFENEPIEISAINFVTSILEEAEIESIKQQLFDDFNNNNMFDYILTCSQFLSPLAKSKTSREIESFVTILSDIITTIPTEQRLKAEEELCNSICSIESLTPIKMKLLNVLYNSAPDYSNEKVLILKHMVTHCDGYEDTLFNFIMDINQSEWKSETPLYRSLLICLYNKLVNVQKTERCREVLIKYLLSFENSQDNCEEAIPYAVSAMLYSLQYITLINDYNELDLRVIAILKENPEYKDLYSLLRCIKSGDLDHFEEKYETVQDFLKDKNIHKESLLASTRLSLLLTLLNKRTVIEFSEIATALHISEDEVEKWIIEGFKNKLIEGKINQVNKTFTITRCNCFDFTKENWELVHSKLTTWKESIEKALESIQSFKH